MAIDHKAQHERVKAAMAGSGHEISYHSGGILHEAKEAVQDAFNTRTDEKTGRSYVKGKKAHKESEFFGGRDLEGDPN